MAQNRSFIYNLIAQLVVFASNMIVNFFLTPYVVGKLGTEAYGFIGLINTVVGYASIATVALNALAGRYITLAYHRGDMKQANEYYSSVFYANTLMSLVILVLTAALTVNVTQVLQIPFGLEEDVQIAVCLSAVNTIISLLSVVYGVAAFIKNKLYLNSLAQMAGSLIRVCVIASLYALAKPHLWFYALAASLAAWIMMILQKRITKKLCSEFQLQRQFFRLDRICEIVREGIWISLENLNVILQTGLDLLITNWFVNPVATGILSIAKTLPNAFKQMTSAVSSVYYPDLARLYATGQKKELVDSFRFSLRFMSMIMMVPLVGFIVFGTDFFSLWLPEEKMETILLIQHVSVLTVVPLLANSVVEVLYYANTLTKKIKGSVLITFALSLAGFFVTIILLYITEVQPLYIIAGTSSMFIVVRCALITPIYAAYVLQVPKTTFFLPLLRPAVIAVFLSGMFMVVEGIVLVDTWVEMLIQCGLCGIVGYFIVYLMLFNTDERKKVVALVRRIIRKK